MFLAPECARHADLADLAGIDEKRPNEVSVMSVLLVMLTLLSLAAVELMRTAQGLLPMVLMGVLLGRQQERGLPH